MSKTAAAKAPAPPANYEAALQELEQLVAALDAGQLPLDQLLAQYQRGAELLRFCRSQLDAVEQQIRVFENGEWKVVEPVLKDPHAIYSAGH